MSQLIAKGRVALYETNRQPLNDRLEYLLMLNSIRLKSVASDEENPLMLKDSRWGSKRDPHLVSTPF